MTAPGEWRNPEHARQLISFSGLRWGSKSPTDIDFFLDWEGKAFVGGEFKHVKLGAALDQTKIQTGQRWAIERAVDTWERGGVPALGFIASHSTDYRCAVVAATCKVHCVRWRGEWLPRDGTVSDLVTGFLKFCGVLDP